MLARIRGVLGSRPYLYGAAAGFVMFAAVYVIDALMARTHMRPEATILDDLLLALLVAALVVSLERQHQRELHLQRERLAITVEMNHHIRNALQSIVYVTATLKGDDRVKIREATDRIEWALTEILPGEQAPATAQAHPNTAGQQTRK